MLDLKKGFYVKSLETNLATQRLVDGSKISFQTIEEMVASKHINPNTISFGQADRLACTILGTNYTQTYRAQGIVFQTNEAPDYISPFDLMLLANVPGEEIKSDYYSFIENLKEHYGRSLIPEYNDFLFKDPAEMLKEFPSPDVAWARVNAFRAVHGLTPVPESQKKLALYNEVIFHRPIIVEPVALFGMPELVPHLRERAVALNLRVFPSAQEFYEKIVREQVENERINPSIKLR